MMGGLSSSFLIEFGQDPKGEYEDTPPGQDVNAPEDLQGGLEGG